MLTISDTITSEKLLPKISRLFDLSGSKIISIEKTWDSDRGTPVFTENGTYTSRGWTEWTQGFQFGSAILQYDATGDTEFLRIGRTGTLDRMAPHLSHIGVHDHGFNNISTYGNLFRLMRERVVPYNEWENEFYILALKVSGAIQAARWTTLGEKSGYIYSFNGPHSLFADTIRSLRSLITAYQLGHVLMGEKDRKISLFHRALIHADTTARYTVYYGAGRDTFDVRGRVAHESIFNLNDGSYRCPNSQQGYSPFSTWARGLAWILCGFAEQLEYLHTVSADAFDGYDKKEDVIARFEKAAEATADFYIEHTPTDGIPYWDTGAPGLVYLSDYLNKTSQPDNEYEPVDSSAALIAAQGLIRLGNYLRMLGSVKKGAVYLQAGLTVADRVFDEPYISTATSHQGLILHSVYHRPNGWDYIPFGKKIPMGESTMWGDYHARELALLIQRMAQNKPYLTFFAVP
jgi:unsaturated chondroitin disaccharide hydrolase